MVYRLYFDLSTEFQRASLPLVGCFGKGQSFDWRLCKSPFESFRFSEEFHSILLNFNSFGRGPHFLVGSFKIPHEVFLINPNSNSIKTKKLYVAPAAERRHKHNWSQFSTFCTPAVIEIHQYTNTPKHFISTFHAILQSSVDGK